MRSLRRTALIWMTAVVTGVGLAGAGLAYGLALREANESMDVQLRQIAMNAGPGLRDNDILAPDHDPEDDIVVQLWTSDGALVHAVPSGTTMPRQTRPGFATIDSAGQSWRIFSSSDADHTVQVAQQMEVRRELAESAALQAAAPLLVVIPLGVLVVGWALGRVLADLDRLAARVEGLPADSREPIGLSDVPAEVVPLVLAMNRLIERLRRSLAQQRKFLSDAAHELRTPLTALNLQITNLGAGRQAATPTDMMELRTGVRRAGTLVDQLLRMARYDAAADTQDHSELDVQTVVFQALADHIALAQSRSIDLGVTRSERASMLGDARELRTLFGNLIDNAVKYTPEGGVVDVAIICRDGRPEVAISDTGPGIDETVMPRVFDRFFRIAAQHQEGSGLGLAIAKAIAERHGMRVALANRTDGGGLRVTISG